MKWQTWDYSSKFCHICLYIFTGIYCFIFRTLIYPCTGCPWQGRKLHGELSWNSGAISFLVHPCMCTSTALEPWHGFLSGLVVLYQHYKFRKIGYLDWCITVITLSSFEFPYLDLVKLWSFAGFFSYDHLLMDNVLSCSVTLWFLQQPAH